MWQFRSVLWTACVVLLLAPSPSLALQDEPLKLASDGKPIVPLPNECRFFRTLLALDGGGMRGIMSVQVLKTLELAIKDYYLDNQDKLSKVDTTSRFVTKEDFHVDLADYFDAFAGISAGSWQMTYLASKGGKNQVSEQILQMEHIRRRFGYVRPGSVQALEVFFMEYGVYIYPPRMTPFTIKPRLFGWPLVQIHGLTVPQSDPKGLEWVLDKFLGDVRLSEVSTSLLVAAFDLNIRATVQFTYDNIQDLPSRRMLRAYTEKSISLARCTMEVDQADKIQDLDKQGLELEEIEKRCQPYTEVPRPADPVKEGKVRTGYVWTRTIPRDTSSDEDFKEPGIKYSSDMDYYLKDLARASSAFPTVHKAKNIKPMFDVLQEYDLIDGAMVGNNPTLQALMWIASSPNINITDVALISIGSGTSLMHLEDVGQGGFLQWVGPVAGLILDSSPEFIQSNLDFMYYGPSPDMIETNQYLRVQVAAENDSPEGRTLSGSTDATALPALADLGVVTATRFKSNIEDFVSRFIFTKCTDPRYGMGDFARLLKKRKEHNERIMEYTDALTAAKADIPPASPKRVASLRT